MEIKEFYDNETSTFTYVVYDNITKDALIIDPVLGYNNKNNNTCIMLIQKIIDFVKNQHLNLQFILETHIHADHLSGSQVLKEHFPKANIGINKNVTEVQKLFADKLKLKDQLHCNGSQFDLLLENNQLIKAGSISVKVIFTPGHTPACTTFLINDCLFVGDAIFLPDLGCGRCDFPGGSAEDLFTSINQIYSYPDHFKIFVGHDYPPKNRSLNFKTTVKEQKENNKALNSKTSKADFIEFRTHRDKQLNEPKLLIPSMKVNLNAGHKELLNL